MPSLTHDAVIDAMRTVLEPELGRDLVSLDMVKNVVIDGTALSMTIELTTPACPLKDEIERTTNAALGAIGAGEPEQRGGDARPRLALAPDHHVLDGGQPAEQADALQRARDA